MFKNYVHLLHLFLIICLIGCGQSEGTKTTVVNTDGKQKQETSEVKEKVAPKYNLGKINWKHLAQSEVNEETLVSKQLDDAVWGYAGACSTNILNANENGIIQTTILENNKSRMFGFSERDINPGYGKINHAIYLSRKGKILIFENGRKVKDCCNYKKSDVVSIEKKNGEIIYKKNNNAFYKTKLKKKSKLIADVAFFNQGATIDKAMASF